MDKYLNQSIKAYEKLVLLCFIIIFVMIASYLYFGDKIFIIVAIINLLQMIYSRYIFNKTIQTNKKQYLEKWIRESL